jgi:peptide/nickel transport system permease protein
MAAPTRPHDPPVGLATAQQRATPRRRPRSPLVLALVRTVRNPMGAFGLGILGLLILVALLAPLIAPFDPLTQYPGLELRRPGWPFLFGTDEFGRDILSRVIHGSRISLVVGIVAVALGAAIGISTGLIAGYFGGWLDAVIMRIWDAMLAFPAVMMGIAVVSVLGPGTLNVALTLAIISLPQFSRLARSLVLSEREREYVLAVRCLGGSNLRIILRHILPNLAGPLLVQLSLAMGGAVLAESGLSFLGLGTQPPDPSWGMMLGTGRGYLRQAPWYGIFPGVAIALLLVGLNFLADALRNALDPRRINT